MMTDLTHLPTPPATTAERIRWTIADGWTVVRRNLDHLRAQPGEIAAELMFPALMVVLFGYVLGSAIRVPGGGNYRLYLMPGLFAMTAISGGISTMMSVASDQGRGVMDRFRSMPMARSAVLVGQTGADIILGVLAMLVMVGFGYLVGWHPTNGPGPAVAAFGLLVLFRYAVSWGGTLLGLTLKEETADKLIPLVFPITMLSNAFVPTENMPTLLRVLANWNPVSALVTACRQLFMGTASVPTSGSLPLPLQHPVAASLLWAVVLLAVFVTLSVRRFKAAGR
ncbi:ABC transporter permease [Aquihabitans sp. McL0605]|uniref:ABC transporter permease n=1 Tax=Aquihabitans sp. McL0605 TaxID=3415671 RepID=UPI003CF69635